MHENRKSFIFYKDQAEQLSILTDTEVGTVMRAVFEYATTGKETAMPDRLMQMCYSFIVSQMKRDEALYDEKCRKLAENAKRKKAKKQKPANASNCNQMQANEGDNVDDDEDVDDDVDEDENEDVDVDADATADADEDADADVCAGAREGSLRSHARSASPSPSMAPPATPSAPPKTETRALLDEEERWSLQSKGVPLAYIEERLSRAAEYAAKTDNIAYNVLLDWWMTDRTHAPWNTSHGRYQGTYRESYRREQETPPHSKPVSFDVEDFFQAALAHAQL